MSGSIFSERASWNVSNMMFSRVLDFAIEVGSQIAPSGAEQDSVSDLSQRITALGSYSPDLAVTELFPTSAQCDFWHQVLSEVASRIYRREVGNQNDQTWQVPTIWAVVDLARVLDSSAQTLRQAKGAV